MKKITLAVLLFLFSAFAWAGTPPNPADYTVNVHVSRSRYVRNGQWVNVTIDGKKYELECFNNTGELLALGDYKARLVKDQHRTTYDSYQMYEFLLPDQKTRKFTVKGQME